jgi:hypothetical protein
MEERNRSPEVFLWLARVLNRASQAIPYVNTFRRRVSNRNTSGELGVSRCYKKCFKTKIK